MTRAAFILSDDTPFAPCVGDASLWQRLFGNEEAAPNPHELPAYLSLARTGEPDALALLYADYHAGIWRLCSRILRRDADAEDAVATTFVKAFAALPRFRGDASLKSWLYRIAVNESTTILRRAARTQTAPDAGSDIVGDSGNGFGIAERIAVRSVLDAIKPDFRVVLVLRYWEELSYSDIATVLGLPLPVVKMRLHRAKEAFRAAYEHAEEAD